MLVESQILESSITDKYHFELKIGFTHSAFTFAYESLVAKSTVAQTDVPPGALITFLQKGLEYVSIEEHINEVMGALIYCIYDFYGL